MLYNDPGESFTSRLNVHVEIVIVKYGRHLQNSQNIYFMWRY
jgi:hypothetical protein